MPVNNNVDFLKLSLLLTGTSDKCISQHLLPIVDAFLTLPLSSIIVSTVLRRNESILAIGVRSATKLIERLKVRFIESMCDNFGFLLLEGIADDSPDVKETSELPHLRFNVFLVVAAVSVVVREKSSEK
ncbi:hypothetical protein GQX74_002639 [Glossina fuscipes]|nr:hypothetical protein GQX74_002639 [Glossina fuscipes]